MTARVALRDLAETITKGESIQWQGEAYQDEGIPFIRTTNVQWEGLDLSSVARVSLASHQRMARSQLQAHDLLISIAGTLGRACIVPPEVLPANINQDLALVRIRRGDVSLPYLLHALRSDFVGQQIGRSGRGAGRIHLNLQQVGSLQVPLPPLPEQRRIAAILDQADELRQKRREEAEALDLWIEAFFDRTFGRRVPDRAGWPEVRVDELSIPGGMRTGPFGSDLRHDQFVTDGVAVLGIDNAVRNRFAWNERRFVTNEVYERLRRYTVRPFDVIVTIMGTTGRTAVVPSDVPLAISTKHLALISVDRSRTEPEWLAHALRLDPDVRRQVEGSRRGAIMDGLNLGLIKRLRLRLPPIALQHRFTGFLEQVRALGDRMRAHGNELDRLEASLSRSFFAKPGYQSLSQELDSPK